MYPRSSSVGRLCSNNDVAEAVERDKKQREHVMKDLINQEKKNPDQLRYARLEFQSHLRTLCSSLPFITLGGHPLPVTGPSAWSRALNATTGLLTDHICVCAVWRAENLCI